MTAEAGSINTVQASCRTINECDNIILGWGLTQTDGELYSLTALEQ